MLERDLVFKQSHIVVVALEAMHHHKEMNPNKIRSDLLWALVELLQYFLLTQLLCVLDHVYKLWISVDAVALFKDERAHFCVLLMNGSKGLYSKLRGLSCDYFIHLEHLFIVFPLDEGKVLVGLTDVMFGLLRQECEIPS